MVNKRTKLRRIRKKHGGMNTKWAIVQYDNRPLNEVDKGLIERNKYYANKWGHEYILKIEGYDHMSPYWRKVFLVKDILSTDKYRGVLWLDTDAAVYDMEKNINDLVKEGKHMYIARDDTGVHAFCAGTWFILNTPIGKEIMEKWTQQHNISVWRKEGDVWKTDGEWSGDNYEQGSFNTHVLPKYSESVKQYDKDFLNALSPKENTFIVHFYFTKNSRKGFLDKNPLPTTGGRRTRRKRRQHR